MSEGKRSPKRVAGYDIYIPSYNIHFDVPAFDLLLRSHGVVLEHWRAIPCPIGVEDRFDSRSHAEHDDCSNGFLYRRAGEVTAFFSGNASNATLENLGIVDGSTVQVTLPRFYDDSEKQVMVQMYDRFYLKETETVSVNGQTFEANQAGVDRMKYPLVRVEHLIDSHGIEYQQGTHYDVIDGIIKWKGQERPGFNPELNRGTICSIRYHYRPFWYVKTLIHEVRVSRDVDVMTGEIKLERMPYAVLLQREYVFENEERSKKNAPDVRDGKAPRSGGFGPR